MANDEHVAILKKGVNAWNAWRDENRDIRPFLTGANLSEADLSKANLNVAHLNGAHLAGANLSGAHLNETHLNRAYLNKANLSGANLDEAHLDEAHLNGAHLNGAHLAGANLNEATLIDTDLTDADLTGCRIFGISAWRLKLEGAKQLDALRDELRNRNLLPILFDFAIPASRDVTETIKTLASLVRFVIADVTDATEVRVELHNIVRDFPSLPIQPILLRGHPEFVSLSHLTRFPWVLPIFEYDHPEHLLASLDKIILAPEAKMKVLEDALEEGRRKIEAELIKPR
jgi:hypothetical protein